ncbi:MAG: ribonuclease P protein component [Bacteroidota bacterium]
MGHSKYSFSKAEKLTGKKKVEELFRTGSSFYLNDIQVRYLKTKEPSSPHQILISVPKRNFKRAVDRNLLKRRIREAYRLNKEIIATKADSDSFYIAFIYLSKQILPFKDIQAQLIKCLKRLGNIKAGDHE